MWFAAPWSKTAVSLRKNALDRSQLRVSGASGRSSGALKIHGGAYSSAEHPSPERNPGLKRTLIMDAIFYKMYQKICDANDSSVLFFFKF
jgi:hypothetical protein